MTQAPTSVTLVIRFTHGLEQTYEFDFTPGANLQVNMASQIQKLFTQNYLLLQKEDRLTMIPMSSIQQLEILAVPPKLPEPALHGVRLISERQIES